MKNKNIIALGATLFLVFGLYAQTAKISDGIINWKGTKVTSDSHSGTIALKNGELNFDGETLTGGSFIVDMNSIVCTDLSGGKAKRLVGHLMADDFFAVAEYPEATLKITDVKAAENGYAITGDFTIRGITNSESFILSLNDNKATAALEIDRSKYNVKFGSGSFFENLGNKLINDELELSVSFSY